jgi:hypothetical protein
VTVSVSGSYFQNRYLHIPKERHAALLRAEQIIAIVLGSHGFSQHFINLDSANSFTNLHISL